MSIAAADLAVVYDLARPLEPTRQPAFVAAVKERLEAEAIFGEYFQSPSEHHPSLVSELRPKNHKRGIRSCSIHHMPCDWVRGEIGNL
jgi:hypothetical protein